ncbi:MAG: DUF5011 domain-containing protein, partial [Candidatus Izemoplasmatales bacterium]|nr:DUF5011 domain-containing protein [Candidatus Izemoplasmatales bacterium]
AFLALTDTADFTMSIDSEFTYLEEASPQSGSQEYDYKYHTNFTTQILMYTGYVIHIGDESVSEDMYMSMGSSGVTLYQRMGIDQPWMQYTMSLEDYLDTSLGGDSQGIAMLLNNSETFQYQLQNGYALIPIALTNENFSLDLFGEMYGFLMATGLVNAFNQEAFLETAEAYYSLIDCTLVMTPDFEEVVGFEFDYTNFLNELSSELSWNDSVISPDDSQFVAWKTTIHGISQDPVSITLPTVTPEEIEYTPAGTILFQYDDEIRDMIVDEENHAFYITVQGDYHLYRVDYLTWEQESIEYPMMPDQMFLRDGTLYVSLTPGHVYFTYDDLVGGVAIVDSATFTKDREFVIDYDPYDIVVDEFGYIYLTHGSNQHGSMRSLDSLSGQVIGSSSSTYENGQILYSDYTNRIYYVELETTKDDLMIYPVSQGVFTAPRAGSDRFEEENLVLDPTQTLIYSQDGWVFQLSDNIGEDGMKSFLLPFEFFSLAFDTEQNQMYFAKEDGIALTNSSYQTIGYYDYSGESQELYYADQMIFNRGTYCVEILDLENPDRLEFYDSKTIDFGDIFSSEAYLTSFLGGSSYEYEIATDSEDLSAFGDHSITYYVTMLFGVSVEMTIRLDLHVVDRVSPRITIADPTDLTINLGDSFTPQECIVTDNYDPNPSCSIVLNEVNTSEKGTYTVTYEATDSSGNTSQRSFVYEVVPPTMTYTSETVTISGAATEVRFDVANQKIYYLLMSEKKLIQYDMTTQLKSEIVFEKTPERLLLQDGKLYVTILHQAHSSYWWDEDQSGEIAIVDASTFTLESMNWVDVDPYSIAVIGGHLFIAPGSGQWAYMFNYDLSDFSKTPVKTSVRQLSLLFYDASVSMLFMVTTDSSPQSLEGYVILNGVIASTKSNYSDWGMQYGTHLFVSPFSDVLFTQYGDVITIIDLLEFDAMQRMDTLTFDISALDYVLNDQMIVFGTPDQFLYFSTDSAYEPYAMIDLGIDIDGIAIDGNTIYVVTLNSSTWTLTTVHPDWNH